MSPAPEREASWPDLLAEPGVAELIELRSRFGFMAFHGGVEGGTFEIAQGAARASDASWYAVVQPEGMRWHVPSREVDPVHSDRLRAFLDHVEVVVAVHGYGRLARPRDVLVGGGDRVLAGHVARCLREAATGFEIVDDLEDIPPRLRGLHPANPVNRASGGGVQLELPPAARGASWRVEDATPRHLVPAGLIDGLAEAARTWGRPT